MSEEDASMDSDEVLGPSDEEDKVTLSAQELLERIEKVSIYFFYLFRHL